MNPLIQASEKLAYSEIEKTGMPIKMHVDLATSKGNEIAQKLNADVNIVHVGTLMVDCVLGEAIKADRVPDHVAMCHKRTQELLADFPDIPTATKMNIEHCVLEHHGASKFYSLESEICCNADCYRFISIKGFTIAIRYLRDMPFDAMIQLVSSKVDEKWNALTLDLCKEELKPQHEVILKVLAELRS